MRKRSSESHLHSKTHAFGALVENIMFLAYLNVKQLPIQAIPEGILDTWRMQKHSVFYRFGPWRRNRKKAWQERSLERPNATNA